MIVSQRVIRAIHAARRYGFGSIERSYKTRVQQLIAEDPLRLYCLSIIFGWEDLARIAANILAFYDIHNSYCVEMETMLVEHYYRLLKYHHECQKTIYNTFSKRLPPVNSDSSTRLGWLSRTYNSSFCRNSVGFTWPAMLEREIDKAVSSSRSKYKFEWERISRDVVEIEKELTEALAMVSMQYYFGR